MLVVADSSALVALATCSALDILTGLYQTVKVPQAVYDETALPHKPQGLVLGEFLRGRIVSVNTGQFVLAAGGLGEGEIEAMSLYKLLEADLLLVDDRRARLVAEANGIRCTGALGVLLQAKRKGLLRRIAPCIHSLRESSLHYDERLLQKVLQLADE
jgi:predicted nucleic acid-binding protein